MDKTYINVIEALIFSSDDSLCADDIINSIKGIDGEDSEITKEEIDAAVDQLNDKYKKQNIAFKIK